MTSLSPHILLTDDDPLHREYLAVLLSASGYRVSEAEDGESALASLATEPFSLVMLDVLMPGIDGIEVCRRIRATPALATLPIIIVTVLSDSESQERAAAAGCTDFLSKPINHVALLKRVENLLQVGAWHNVRSLARSPVEVVPSYRHIRRLVELGLRASRLGEEIAGLSTSLGAIAQSIRARDADEMTTQSAAELERIRIEIERFTHTLATLDQAE